MPDIYASVTQLDAATQERLGARLETRGSDAQHQEMHRAFFADIPFPPQSRVLEIGCGTGVQARALAALPQVAVVVGIDPGVTLLTTAREFAADLPNVTFEEADGRSLPFADASFDVVVIHTTLAHVPHPEQVLAEAFRVLPRGGVLAVFDTDYPSWSIALSEHDLLQSALAALGASGVLNFWLLRQLPGLVRGCGFGATALRSYSVVETVASEYTLLTIDRSADSLHNSGQIGAAMAEALKAEARRRSAAGMFFGFIAYGSLITRKPA